MQGERGSGGGDSPSDITHGGRRLSRLPRHRYMGVSLCSKAHTLLAVSMPIHHRV